MKRFTFKLQSLLNYRTYLEKMARLDAAKAGRDLSDCQDRIEQCHQSLVEAAVKMDEVVAKGTDAHFIQRFVIYINGLNADLANETRLKQKLSAVLAEKVKVLNQKSKEKKVMERLKEKQRLAYNRELLRLEQKDLDEISSLKSAREVANATE